MYAKVPENAFYIFAYDFNKDHKYDGVWWPKHIEHWHQIFTTLEYEIRIWKEHFGL